MERVLQELDPASQAKFSHGVCFVDFDRLVAQVQTGRNLLVAVALRHQAQHFGFAIAEGWSTAAPALPLLIRKR